MVKMLDVDNQIPPPPFPAKLCIMDVLSPSVMEDSKETMTLPPLVAALLAMELLDATASVLCCKKTPPPPIAVLWLTDAP